MKTTKYYLDTPTSAAYVRSFAPSLRRTHKRNGRSQMNTSTIEEITAIAAPRDFEVPLQEPLATGSTAAADTRLLEDFASEEPVYGHWSQPSWTAEPHMGPLLPEEIGKDLPPDEEIYEEAVGAFQSHLALAVLALSGLTVGVVAALFL